jgi:hexosaminidase
MYWVITNDTYLAPGDIVHYWGATADIKDILSKFPDNDIVMSPWDNLYLDCGLGNLFGDGSWCGKYRTWKDIYDFNPVVNGTRPG